MKICNFLLYFLAAIFVLIPSAWTFESGNNKKLQLIIHCMCNISFDKVEDNSIFLWPSE